MTGGRTECGLGLLQSFDSEIKDSSMKDDGRILSPRVSCLALSYGLLHCFLLTSMIVFRLGMHIGGYRVLVDDL